MSRRRLLFLSLLLTAALTLFAHALSRHGAPGLSPIFFYLFTVGDAAGLQCALAILLAAAWPGRHRITPLLEWIEAHTGWIAGASVVILSGGAWLVYRRAPLSMDEYAAFFQSRVFAAGHIAGRFPPPLLDWLIPRGFQDYFLNVTHDTGRVTSAYWPSFALLITPFTWLGVPWACNPVISALTLLAVRRLSLRIFSDHAAAGLAVLLTVASPVFFADGISFYSMSAHLLANTVYALLLAAPTRRRALTAGVVGSVALTLHNPVPHLVFALPWIVMLWRRPDGPRLTLSLIAGYAPLCLLLGVGWFLITSPTALSNGLPTGADIRHLSSAFAWPTSTVLLARAIGLAKVWAWAVPGVIVLAVAGAWRWRKDDACRALTRSALLTLAAYVFVPFDQGHGWGYRYFHSAWIAVPILAAAALTRRPAQADGTPAREAYGTGDTDGTGDTVHGAARFIVACALLSLLAGTGLRALQIRAFIVRHQGQLPAYAGTGQRVVILDTRAMFYGRDLVQNDPFLRDPTTIMITHGTAADAAMMRANYPRLTRLYADRSGSVWAVKP